MKTDTPFFQEENGLLKQITKANAVAACAGLFVAALFCIATDTLVLHELTGVLGIGVVLTFAGGMGFHFKIVHPQYRKINKVLEIEQRGGHPDAETIETAWKAAIAFPRRSVKYATYIWLGAASLELLLLPPVMGVSVWRAIVIFLAGLSGGLIGPNLCYFLYRRWAFADLYEHLGRYRVVNESELEVDRGSIGLLIRLTFVGLTTVVVLFLALYSIIDRERSIRDERSRVAGTIIDEVIHRLDEQGVIGNISLDPDPVINSVYRDPALSVALFTTSGKLMGGRTAVEITQNIQRRWRRKVSGVIKNYDNFHLVRFTRIPKTNLLVVATMKKDFNFQEFMESNGIFVVIAVLAFLYSLMIGYWLETDIVNPLRRMAIAAELATAGKLQQTGTNMTDDEVGRLSRAFTKMLSGLISLVRTAGDTTGAIEATSATVTRKVDEVVFGSKRQNERIDDATASLERMKKSISQGEVLAAKVAEMTDVTASSGNELKANVGSISSMVEGITSSIESGINRTSGLLRSSGLLDDGVDHLRREVEESSSAVAELNMSLQHSADNAKESASLAAQADADAGAGVDAVARVQDGMGSIREFTKEVANVIFNLRKRAEDISRILGAIGDIAKQTNLLSLNASIIAAEAGEQGQPFAVIASEINKLSEQTSRQTNDIYELIESVTADARQAEDVIDNGFKIVTAGAEKTIEASKILERIKDHTGRSRDTAGKIAKSNQQQSQTVSLLSQSIEHLARHAGEVADRSVEQTGQARALSEASEKMKPSMDKLRRSIAEHLEAARQIATAVEDIRALLAEIEDVHKTESTLTEDLGEAVTFVREEVSANVVAVRALGDAVSQLAVKMRNLQRDFDAYEIIDRQI